MVPGPKLPSTAQLKPRSFSSHWSHFTSSPRFPFVSVRVGTGYGSPPKVSTVQIRRLPTVHTGVLPPARRMVLPPPSSLVASRSPRVASFLAPSPLEIRLPVVVLSATAGVLSGGIFNVFGDYFFVFPCNMGVFGAGLATAMGAAVSFLVMLTHFRTRANTLRLVPVRGLGHRLGEISVTGFSSFFIDVAMGILTVLFNRQTMKYLGPAALAVYGPIINVSTFVQCCAYSVGQASQPIISTNFGAGKAARIRETLRLALWTVAFFGLFWTALSMACPDLYIRVFMTPTQEILDMAPAIIRTYALSFLLLPFNIFSTYYFQAILRPKAAFVVSVARGSVISGSLILVLPPLVGPDALWLAMPITELLTMLYAAAAIRRCTAALPQRS